MRILTTLILLFGLFLSPHFAWADLDCWNSDRTFYNCATESGGSAGVSAPLLGETFSSNPANLPVRTTPFGLEAILSDRSTLGHKLKVNVSTVKGFDGLGFGLGTWTKGTFSAPDFPAHFLNESNEAYWAYEKSRKTNLGIRLGGTIGLRKKLLPKFMKMTFGASVGLGQTSGEYSPQFGSVLTIFGLGFGYSINFDRLSKDLPPMNISVYSVGFLLRTIYFGYSHSTIHSSVNDTSSNALIMRVPLRKWTLYGGWKFQKDHRGVDDNWHRGGIQRRIGKRLGLGYEYGYYRHSHSALMQVYL